MPEEPIIRVISGREKESMATGRASPGDRTSEIAIFARLLKADEGHLRPDLARYLLTLGFDEQDQDRMRDLAERSQEGTLSAQDQDELRSFVKAGHLLALLHSKARRSLKAGKDS
jgi:hypothetical protein